MITSMTVTMLGLSPLLRPIPIHHTDDRPPLLADGPLAKGEGTSIRIQGNASCAAYTGSEVRMLVPDLHADGAALLAEACQGYQALESSMSAAASCLPLSLDDPATARRLVAQRSTARSVFLGTGFTGSSVLAARSLHSYTGLRG